MKDMVIAGAGECGTRAAFALREYGWTGGIVLIGAEAGLPYERPPLSKPADNVTVRKNICERAAFADAGITYMDGRSAVSIDPARQCVTIWDGIVIPYEKLLLATGARPRPLDCRGAEHALYFRTFDEAFAVFSRAAPGRNAVIVGAGLIGMELAAILKQRGLHVAVIELAAKPLGRAVPPSLANHIYERHLSEGVTFRFGRAVVAIDEASIELDDGSTLAADMVIAAVGVEPETALAERASIPTGHGIHVNARMETGICGIYAAGDCAAVRHSGDRHIRFESWRNARAQAETAAHNMIGAEKDFAALPWFWSDQYDLGLQVTGLPQDHHVSVTRERADGARIEFYLDEGLLVAAAGLGKGNAVAKEIKLAELLIHARAHPDPAMLKDQNCSLKAALKNT